MNHRRLADLLVVLLFTMSSAFAQDPNPGNNPIDGILGKYLLQEKWDFWDKVIAGQTNLFGDEVQLAVPENIFDKAKRALAAIDKYEVLTDTEAVFYIFPKNDEPIVLFGSIMSGAQDMNDYHSAGLTIITPDSVLLRLRNLPKTTLVYGLDKDREIAWFPLRFFEVSDTFENTIQAGGIYAYKYRPSSDILKEYGNPAYYMDLQTLRKVYGSHSEVLSDDVVINVTGLSDRVAMYAQKAKTAFINVLNTCYGESNKYAQNSYDISIAYSNNRGLINLKAPIKVTCREYGNDIAFQPDLWLFEALAYFKDAWRAALLNEEPAYVDIVGRFPVSVTSCYEGGEITIQSQRINERPYFDAAIDFSYQGKTYRLKSKNPDEMVMTGVFTLPPETGIDGIPQEAVRYLKTYLTDNCKGADNDDDETHDKRQSPDSKHNYDWKSEYDTFRQPADTSAAPTITEEPTFLGGGLSHFAQWVNSRIEYPQIAIENYIEGTVVVEFVIKQDGSLSNINVVKTPDKSLSNEVVRVMGTAPAWIPGKCDNVPVSVKYSMPVSFSLSD